jgi:hypothetical protein
MAALVACETILLVLLVVLVAGLLRSHAEILRRLGPPGSEALPQPPEAGATPAGASDIAGLTLEGDAVKVSLAVGAPPTLIAFLTSGCAVCRTFWDALRDGHTVDLPRAGSRVLVVTKDTSHESPSRLGDLRPEGVPLIMSSAAWDAHAVPAAPYFVYVEDGAVLGEGSASTWKQVEALLRDSFHDAAHGGNGNERTDRIDATLRAGGIEPGHPSLYPDER